MSDCDLDLIGSIGHNNFNMMIRFDFRIQKNTNQMSASIARECQSSVRSIK